MGGHSHFFAAVAIGLAAVVVPPAAAQNFIAVSWEADGRAVRTARYNRQLQNPGGVCSPSPCGENTQCTVNNQGNPICSCVPGYIPMPSPVDGCCPPNKNPTSPVILQNRLSEGPGYLSVGAPRPRGDPCSPTPCGPGTTCSLNRDGNPECRCVAGYTPNPDTITGCKPECNVDPDCRMGFVCRSHQCQKKPDPCDPNPCGPGARCSVNGAGNAICQCEPGLIPKPDTITGCGPECVRDADCLQRGRDQVCQSQRCVARPDPCDPSPCGPGAQCSVTGGGNAICRCQPGLIPNPDTISGCKPECLRDPDCQHGYVCQSQRCVEKPDPCDPSPCGPGAECSVTGGGNAICRCQPGLIPNPDTISGCKPECVRDPDCSNGYVCTNQRCVERPDPCQPSPCGPGAVCTLNLAGNPICRCERGLIPKPDTITGCGPECVRDPDCQTGYICQGQRCVVKPDPCSPSPCGPNTQCMANSAGNPICRCLPGFVPMPDTISGCKRECERDPDCGAGRICLDYRCADKPDPCDPSPCGPNTECTVTGNGNPICRCLPTYIPKPDTITGCGRECERDSDCGAGNICQNYRCAPRPDPCKPSPCGPNTECSVNRLGNPVCTCLGGFAPQPDTITGCTKIEARTPPPDPCQPSPCGPHTRCEVNRLGNPVCRCLPGYIPLQDTISGCELEPDPCQPSPCGLAARCTAQGRRAVCECPPGYKGDPYAACKKGDCEYDHECASSLACFDFHCRDPCIGACGSGAVCEVRDHRPICSCPQGYTGDPLASCDRKIVVGGRYSPPAEPEARNTIVIGQEYNDRRPEEAPSSRIIVGGRYQPIVEEAPLARHVVGSRYNGGGGGSALCSSPCGGGDYQAAASRSAVVVGSGFRRRRRGLRSSGQLDRFLALLNY